jgi:hypothetical protein
MVLLSLLDKDSCSAEAEAVSFFLVSSKEKGVGYENEAMVVVVVRGLSFLAVSEVNVVILSGPSIEPLPGKIHAYVKKSHCGTEAFPFWHICLAVLLFHLH